MSKQLKPNQWLELFDTYETQGIHALWFEYGAYRNINKNSKYLFFKKYKKIFDCWMNLNHLLKYKLGVTNNEPVCYYSYFFDVISRENPRLNSFKSSFYFYISEENKN